MSTIVTRASKGLPLTWQEADNNFKNLNYSSFFSVKDSAYGAVGNGVADDTVACQAAINAAVAAGGGIVYFPPGWYAVSKLTITSAQITLRGANQATHILAVDNISNVIDIPGGVGGINIEDLYFSTKTGTQRTGGWYVWATGGETYITNCKFVNGYAGIYLGTNNSICTIDSCYFSNFNNNNASPVIVIDSIGADFSINECVFDNNASLMPSSGIFVKSVQDLTISNCNIIHCGDDLYLGPATGQTVTSVYCSNVFFDTAKNGIVISPQVGGALGRCQFLNCWTSSHTQRGVVIDGSLGNILGVCFTNHQTHLNTLDGILIKGSNTTDIVFNGGEASQNGGSGFTSGVNTTSFFLRNFHAGSGHGLSGNSYGAYINTGATNYEISGCVFEGNTSDQFIDLSKTGRVFHNYNPTGVKTYNSGTSLIPIGTNNVYITHGLNTTPSLGDIHLTPHTGYTNNWLSLVPGSVNSTQFQVVSQIVVAGYNFTFGWSASCQNDH